MFGDVCGSHQLLVKTTGKQKGLCLSRHTHVTSMPRVCLYRRFCFAYFIKEHTSTAQKYDPEMLVSEKDRGCLWKRLKSMAKILISMGSDFTN